MKILKAEESYLAFDNGSYIASSHDQECCEHNYADFEAVDDIALNTDFTEPLDFESCEDGFRFGNQPNKMFFVPCYSMQNGWYSRNIKISYNSKKVLITECELDSN